jgi:hypothetical protein
MTMTSGLGHEAGVSVGTTVSPASAVMGPGRVATNRTRASGQAPITS